MPELTDEQIEQIAERVAKRLGIDFKSGDDKTENLRRAVVANSALSRSQVESMEPETLAEIAASLGVQASDIDVPMLPDLTTAEAGTRLGEEV